MYRALIVAIALFYTTSASADSGVILVCDEAAQVKKVVHLMHEKRLGPLDAVEEANKELPLTAPGERACGTISAVFDDPKEDDSFVAGGVPYTIYSVRVTHTVTSLFPGVTILVPAPEHKRYFTFGPKRNFAPKPSAKEERGA